MPSIRPMFGIFGAAALVFAGVMAGSGLSANAATAGVIATTPATCQNGTHKDTSVGITAGACPATTLGNRRFVTFCNSLENSGSPLIKIRIDGVAPVMGLGNPGDVLAVGNCVTYNTMTTTAPQCIASAATTHLTSLECQ